METDALGVLAVWFDRSTSSMRATSTPDVGVHSTVVGAGGGTSSTGGLTEDQGRPCKIVGPE